FIEKISQRDSHERQRDLLDYPGKGSYPVNVIAVATENTETQLTDEATVSLQRSIYDPGYVNAMSHFYRGEMGRIMVWRQRLDITTNWAITSSTAIITIAFSNAGVPNIFLHAPMAMNSVSSFYGALRVGHIPSWLVAFVFVGTFLSVITITIYVSKKSSGEISEFGTHRSLWRI